MYAMRLYEALKKPAYQARWTFMLYVRPGQLPDEPGLVSSGHGQWQQSGNVAAGKQSSASKAAASGGSSIFISLNGRQQCQTGRM